jgi:hypothetical protein
MVNIDEIKQANPIQDLIDAEFTLAKKNGRYLHALQHDSLVVDVAEQIYYWNSRSESGDVIEWVMKRRNIDFKSAVEFLARRAGLPDPEWGHGEVAARLAANARADAWTVAKDVFAHWLWMDEDALAYARSRAWTDEIIKDHVLGYSGKKAQRAALRKQLRDKLVLAGNKEDDPAVVALIGYNGDVRKWAEKHNLSDQIKNHANWIEKGYIPGVVGSDMLVYPHLVYKKCVYFSLRGVTEKKHYNLPVILAEDRRLYFNAKWSSNESLYVIVEGQADAITLAQWGIPAIALCGVFAGDDLKRSMRKETKIFVGLDNDQGGKKNIKNVCESLFPLARVIHWPEQLNKESIKDGNDLLKAWKLLDIESQSQIDQVNAFIVNSISYLEEFAAEVGQTKDETDRNARELEVMKLFMKLDEIQQAQYRTRVAKAMNRQLRDFDRLVKQIAGIPIDEDKDKPSEIISTWGGCFHNWLIEYLYDPVNKTAVLAYRDPDGRVGKAAYVDIWVNAERIRYVPEEPYDFVHNQSIVFPSDLGEIKPQRELVAIIAAFLSKHYLFDDVQLPRVVAYYVLMTWLYDAFNAVSYLRAIGPAGCGKSELMKRVGWLCYRPTKSSGNDTTAVTYRTIEMFGGTLIVEEYDQSDSSTTDSYIKVLNSGAMRGGTTNRLVEYEDQNGAKKLRPQSFSTYCPKLLDGRMDTKDDAVGTRCITFRVMPHTQLELLEHGVPLFIDDEFRDRALTIQNLLLRWRLETWKPEIKILNKDIDPDISPRMNQVTLAMKAIARLSEDDAVQDELTRLLRDIYSQEVLTRAESMTARIIESCWKIFLYPELHKKEIIEIDGELCLYPGAVAMVADNLIDEMNKKSEDVDEEEDPKKNNAKVHPHKVGKILRNELQLKVKTRNRRGIPYVWHETRMIALADRNGVDWKRVLGHVLSKRKADDIPKAVLDLANRRKISAAAYAEDSLFGGFDDALLAEGQEEVVIQNELPMD